MSSSPWAKPNRNENTMRAKQPLLNDEYSVVQRRWLRGTALLDRLLQSLRVNILEHVT